MHIPVVVCTRCERAMEPSKNGLSVEMLSGGLRGQPAESYYKIQGDAYVCPGCGFEIVTRFAKEPLAQAYEPHYAAMATAYKVPLG
jgi:predicted RNA-binding Zn-ribbon protein involved in translation (DUF1610 family)